ncbi:MAG: ribose 5-phosphate isomerase B [Peptococcaceae bacterium]|jgi:ribose 5-phosphate isomerase B|nr:ribose 5-phosphate isomerase B [Peptococcaceae bacterium]
MNVIIGSDHGGFKLKAVVKEWLEAQGYQVTDVGTHSEESCDYPDIARLVAQPLAKGEYDRGIVICGTGIGISITANKVPGIRAALCGDTFSAKMSRMHNNANILAMGERVIGQGLALEILETWFATEFEAGGRHETRVAKIEGRA